MNGLMLANQSAMDNWLLRNQSMVQFRTALAMRQLPVTGDRGERSAVTSFRDDWWDHIRSQAEGCEFERHGSVAVIKCVGALSYKYSFWSWLYDADCYMGIAAKVRAAKEDTGIDKIVLYIDSPGGTHHGVVETSDVIWDARSAKEVVAVVDPEAASAGYWLASQANRIVAIQSGWVGSLGSQVFLYSEKRMFDEMGVDIEVLRASISPKKNQGIPYEAITDEAREERQGWVDHAGEEFISHVERGRGKSRDFVLKNYGQGMMFFTPDAIGRGMVDAIGSFQAELVSKSAGERNRRVRNDRGARDSRQDVRIDRCV